MVHCLFSVIVYSSKFSTDVLKTKGVQNVTGAPKWTTLIIGRSYAVCPRRFPGATFPTFTRAGKRRNQLIKLPYAIRRHHREQTKWNFLLIRCGRITIFHKPSNEMKPGFTSSGEKTASHSVKHFEKKILQFSGTPCQIWSAPREWKLHRWIQRKRMSQATSSSGFPALKITA